MRLLTLQHCQRWRRNKKLQRRCSAGNEMDAEPEDGSERNRSYCRKRISKREKKIETRQE
jgi:hypothetical protein